jgi:hypothetical protein
MKTLRGIFVLADRPGLDWGATRPIKQRAVEMLAPNLFGASTVKLVQRGGIRETGLIMVSEIGKWKC